MVNSRGDSLDNKVEVQCEIEAALVPARIADMAAINQTYQWHEYIQDTNLAGESPLFSGSIGAMTAGVEALGFMGLKKAHWNTMKMLAKLGAQQLYSTSDYAQYGGDPPDMTVNVVAAADTISDIIQVLVWSYIDPSRYDGVVVSGPDPANRTDYNYLYDYIEADIGSDTIFVSVSINDLGSDYAQTSLQQWTIDKYTSNAFEYREAICWALGLAGCTGSYPDSTFTLQQVNAWTSTTSPAVYGSPSVDLERTTTQDVIAIDDYNVILGMLPYSVVMMTLQGFDGPPSPGDSEMTGTVVGRAPILSHRRHN
jgi:hypothetical protein